MSKLVWKRIMKRKYEIVMTRPRRKPRFQKEFIWRGQGYDCKWDFISNTKFICCIILSFSVDLQVAFSIAKNEAELPFPFLLDPPLVSAVLPDRSSAPQPWSPFLCCWLTFPFFFHFLHQSNVCPPPNPDLPKNKFSFPRLIVVPLSIARRLMVYERKRKG